MPDTNKRQRNLDMAIITMWLHWAVATGALAAPILLGYFIPLKLLPIIVFAEVIALYGYIRSSTHELPRCYLIMHICARALLLSGVIMLLINIAFTIEITHAFFSAESLNPEIPFIPTLIISPAAFLFALIASIRRSSQSFCRGCFMQHGIAMDRGVIGEIFKSEGHRQSELLAWLTAIISIFDWIYYLCYYINVNLNRPDTFFFVVIPTCCYVLTLVYIALRYIGMMVYYNHRNEIESPSRGRVTRLRYLVVHNNAFYLAPQHPGSPDSRLDTPFEISLDYQREIPEATAKELFHKHAQIEQFKLKYAYSTEAQDTEDATHLYFVTVDDPAEIASRQIREGQWYTLFHIKHMLNTRLLTSLIQTEIVRIYTMVMAWKMYDREGNRRYKIKKYRPAFNLQQLHDWDIDLNDTNWLIIACNNEDKRSFRWKRAVNRILFGNKQ